LFGWNEKGLQARRTATQLASASDQEPVVTARENVKAETAAFATFSPFKSRFHRHWERVVFALAPLASAEVRKRKFLHYAYFVSLSPRRLRRAGVPKHELRHGALLFLSAFNGDAEAYFKGFSEKLSLQMNDLWGGNVDWKDAAVYAHLDAFIARYRRRVDFYSCRYPDRSTRIRGALRLRQGLDQLLALARSPSTSDVAVRDAYEQLAQAVWGNADQKPRGKR
jgi:hypothetical protein